MGSLLGIEKNARLWRSLCELEDAKMILDLAGEIYPHAVPHVQESISLARKPQSAAAW